MKLVRLGIGIVVLVLSIGYWGFLKYWSWYWYWALQNQRYWYWYWYCSNHFLGIGIGIEVEIYGIVCVCYKVTRHAQNQTVPHRVLPFLGSCWGELPAFDFLDDEVLNSLPRKEFLRSNLLLPAPLALFLPGFSSSPTDVRGVPFPEGGGGWWATCWSLLSSAAFSWFTSFLDNLWRGEPRENY